MERSTPAAGPSVGAVPGDPLHPTSTSTITKTESSLRIVDLPKSTPAMRHARGGSMAMVGRRSWRSSRRADLPAVHHGALQSSGAQPSARDPQRYPADMSQDGLESSPHRRSADVVRTRRRDPDTRGPLGTPEDPADDRRRRRRTGTCRSRAPSMRACGCWRVSRRRGRRAAGAPSWGRRPSAPSVSRSCARTRSAVSAGCSSSVCFPRPWRSAPP